MRGDWDIKELIAVVELFFTFITTRRVNVIINYRLATSDFRHTQLECSNLLCVYLTWARDVNGRDRDIGFISWDESETRCETTWAMKYDWWWLLIGALTVLAIGHGCSHLRLLKQARFLRVCTSLSLCLSVCLSVFLSVCVFSTLKSSSHLQHVCESD